MKLALGAALLLVAGMYWAQLFPPVPEPAREVARAPQPDPAPALPVAQVTQVPTTPAPVAPSVPRVRVVFDPGHGGKDPGGAGKHTTDRDIATAVAAQLQVLLAGDPRIEAVFTRDTDRFVSLDDRVAIARGANAVAFVSLHANVWRSRGHASGLEVGYPSAGLAKRELATAIDHDPTRPWTLPEMAEAGSVIYTQRLARARSEQLARSLHDHLVAATGQRGRGTRPAGYRVLRPLEMPTCLIELGFLTDPAEEALMMTPAWQQSAARGIRDGLVAWLDAQAVQRPEPQLVADAARSFYETVQRAPAIVVTRAVRPLVRPTVLAAPLRPAGRARQRVAPSRAGSRKIPRAVAASRSRH